MMEKIEVVKVMKEIEKIHNRTFTPEQVEAWYKYLGHYDLETFKKGIEKLILTCRYFPTIADADVAIKKSREIMIG